MNIPLWKTEFGDEYQVPAELDQLVEAGQINEASWHNDVSPSYTDKQGRFRLWVEHVDPKRREMQGPRFIITPEEEPSDMTPPARMKLRFTGRQLWEGDDLEEALRQFRSIVAYDYGANAFEKGIASPADDEILKTLLRGNRRLEDLPTFPALAVMAWSEGWHTAADEKDIRENYEEVATFPNGFRNEMSGYAGWLLYEHLNPRIVTGREPTGAIKYSIYLPLREVVALRLVQLEHPARWGNPPREQAKPWQWALLRGQVDPVEITSYPIPNEDQTVGDTIMVRMTPGDPTTLTEVKLYDVAPFEPRCHQWFGRPRRQIGDDSNSWVFLDGWQVTCTDSEGTKYYARVDHTITTEKPELELAFDSAKALRAVMQSRQDRVVMTERPSVVPRGRVVWGLTQK